MSPDRGDGSGRDVRMRRLYRHERHRLLVTPLDHTLALGPVVPAGSTLDDLVADLTRGGSDAVVMHKGAVRHVHPQRRADVSLIVHLNGSTPMSPDPDEKVMLCSVAEAVRLGADAVSVHVNLGSDTEAQQLRDLAGTAEHCDRWGLPMLAMVYPRGRRVRDPYDPDLVLRAVTIGAELGADLVKTVQLPEVAAMRDIVAQCPVPVLAAGGEPAAGDAQLLAKVRDALAAGVGGMALGRALFGAADPARTTAKVAAMIHRRTELVSPGTYERKTDDVDRELDQALLA